MMRKTKLFETILLTSLLASSPWVLAEAPSDATQAEASTQLQPLPKDQQAATDKAIESQKQVQNKKLEIINESVFGAFEKIKQAATLIEQNKDKAAIEALQAATGKFDVALEANPELGMVPIYSGVSVAEMLNTPDEVEKGIKTTIELLKKHKVQLAREMLAPMRDEMVTATTYLPMATYPAAVKKATKLLIDGKQKAALNVLNQAFSTLVTKASIIPLGLVRAEALLLEASQMDKEKDKAKVRKYLESAQAQLKLAELLGYTDKHAKEYADLEQQITALEKEVEGANKVEQLYARIKSAFHSLIGKESQPQEKEPAKKAQ